ncbi:hypothetical protein [Natronorubrum sp. FCH18a]|uniref:hypothetical protein n=1 Tax=Natronorubrum sp. FCH18a TaxID=3447018 RepID=UPI003F519DCA
MKPNFEPTEDGLEIIDPIERHRYRLTTHKSVTLEPMNPDQIQYPVDSAIKFTTEMITLPTNDMVYVRDGDGEMVAEVRPSKQAMLPRDEYTLDLSGPIKVYACVESEIQIYSDTDRTYITFGSSTQVALGARSYHRRPAGTITTTTDPTDVMRAVSAFGSALKSTAPERSYPTQRGHPPAIELGNELAIPDEFESPETGVRIEVPPTLGHVFVVTPLAYYLGAEVVPDSAPRVCTASGFTYELDGDGGFEATVERVLKQVFLLDCILRTEGATPLSLPEREAIEPDLTFDIESLYDRPLAEQLETYLSESVDTVEPHLPKWRLKTHLTPDGENIEFLPFITDRLSIVSVQKETQTKVIDRTQKTAIEGFTRGASTRSTASVRGAKNVSTTEYSIPTIEQLWNDAGSSSVKSTAPLSAFQNNIGRKPTEDPIAIEVVCNDQNMRKELQTVNGVYGSHKELPFDVTVHYDLCREEFTDVLSREKDFFHYIGHIDHDGYQCSDGKIDGEVIESVGAKAFLLNACQSYEQGLHLVEAGSMGGIVTFGDVVNSGAISIGETIARLLNQGFPLYAALEISRKENVTGEQYRIVGDGITTIAQSKTRTPTLCSVSANEGTSVELTMYVSSTTGKGGLFKPYLEPISLYHVLPGKTEQIQVTKPQLTEFFELEELPVLCDEMLYWSNEVTVSELYNPP